MTLDNPILVACLVVGVLAAVAFVVVFGLRSRVQIVPEGQQVVVSQLGRFHRIDGPGPVVLNRSVDKIEQFINVRNEPGDCHVVGLFTYRLPFGYTLNFWRRTDLVAASAGNRERLVELALFNDDERRAQLVTVVRQALVDILARLERQHPLPDDASVGAKLLPVLPGIPQCDQLLAELQRELQYTLPAIGIFSDPSRPITIRAVHIGADVVESFSRGRKLSLLREQMPGLTPDMLLQAFGAVEGLDTLHINRFLLEGNLPANLELRAAEDDVKPKLKLKPMPVEPPSQASSATRYSLNVNNNPPREILTPDDLAVAKPVPPVESVHRATG